MGKRAASDHRGDMPSLTPTAPSLQYGTIIVIDIDRMGDIVEERGLNPYKPNDITGRLSMLVDSLARRWNMVVVYGLDWDRGTEEAVLEAPGVDPGELRGDLLRIAVEMKSVGASVTIVAVTGPVSGRPARERREAYTGPRRRAKRILEMLKRRGGSTVYIDGEIFNV